MADDVPVYVTSGYGARTKVGFVHLMIGLDSKGWQLHSDEARRIAGMLWDAAAAADVDAWLMAWAQEALGLDEHQSAQLMVTFREWRSDASKTEAPEER